jgi:hypothetical protein
VYSFTGAGGIRQDPRCPEAFCVAIEIRDITWADEASRRVILATLQNHKIVCKYAEEHGLNGKSDAAAAGCYNGKFHSVKIAVEVKYRLLSPCISISVGRGAATRPVCTNSTARLIFLGAAGS